jgi:hypothetical protein
LLVAAIISVALLAACAGTDHAKPPSPSPSNEGRVGTGGTPVPRDGVEVATPPTAPTPPAAAAAPPAAPAPPEPVPQVAAASLREVFPHVRVDAKAGVLEFDAIVSIDAHDPKKPSVYLETLACIADSKEYESLVVTKAKPSHVHAALLLMGLSPGTPGRWVWQGDAIRGIPPKGPRVKVRMVVSGRETPPGEWVRDLTTNTRMSDLQDGDEFVFAGSVMAGAADKAHYKADVEGCLVGLTTFGSETIAWTRMSNPESGTEAPHWVADPSLPNFGEPVVVRVVRLDDAK